MANFNPYNYENRLGRCTSRDEYGNADVKGVNMSFMLGLPCEEMAILAQALNRLADFEDAEIAEDKKLREKSNKKMSDDLISRQAAIDAYLETVEPIAVQEWDGEISACARDRDILEMLENLPSAQPKTGRWILDTTQFLPEYVCTNCKSRFPLVASEGEFYSTLCCENMNYCPNCGAKMEGKTK